MARSRRVLTKFAGIRVAGATRTDWRACESRLLRHQRDLVSVVRQTAPGRPVNLLEAPRIAAGRHQHQLVAIDTPLREIDPRNGGLARGLYGTCHVFAVIG